MTQGKAGAAGAGADRPRVWIVENVDPLDAYVVGVFSLESLARSCIEAFPDDELAASAWDLDANAGALVAGGRRLFVVVLSPEGKDVAKVDDASARFIECVGAWAAFGQGCHQTFLFARNGGEAGELAKTIFAMRGVAR